MVEEHATPARHYRRRHSMEEDIGAELTPHEVIIVLPLYVVNTKLLT